MPTGHYEFNRMSFGLKNAPSAWQRLMYAVLAGLVGFECLVYLDDIIVYSNDDIEEHVRRLKNVSIGCVKTT